MMLLTTQNFLYPPIFKIITLKMGLLMEKISDTANFFKQEILEGEMIRVVTHLDTDGITSGSIFSKALKRLDFKFWLSVVKQLEPDFIEGLKKDYETKKFQYLVFLDLGSSNLRDIEKIGCKTLILDHHYLPEGFDLKNLDKKILFVNSRYLSEEEISAAGIVYLFSRELSKENSDLAELAVLGMVGDMLDENLGKINNNILKDALEKKVQVKKSLPLFSLTRPVHKSLEFSSSIFIPGVTGNSDGALQFLREAGIELKFSGGRFKTILDLTKEEISRILTGIILRRNSKENPDEILRNTYLIKFSGKLEDARELSAMMNACGRLGYGAIAISLCLGNKDAFEKAESIYNSYKYKISRALNWINSNSKINGDGYVIINAKDNIGDTIIGTAVSILSCSFIYPEGTILVGMSYRKDDKIKVSVRISGKNRNNAINLKESLSKVINIIGGEVGGHDSAAGCLIEIKKEKVFLELLKKELELINMKVKI